MSGASLILSESSNDYYQILGLAPPTLDKKYEAKDIRKAYRRRALELHPDKNKDDPSAPALFNKLTDAYEFLHDDSRRETYDNNILVKERRKAEGRVQDEHKRKLAEQLRHRERAHERAQQKTPSARVQQPIVTHEEREARRERERRKNEIHREALKAQQKAVQKAPQTSQISADYFFIVRVEWHSRDWHSEAVHKYLRSSAARHTFTDLLKPHEPYRVLKVDEESGLATFQFFDQSRAIAAAMTLTMLDDEGVGVGAKLAAEITFSARVVKKPRRLQAASSSVQSQLIEDDEWDSLLEERTTMQAKIAQQQASQTASQSEDPSVAVSPSVGQSFSRSATGISVSGVSATGVSASGVSASGFSEGVESVDSDVVVQSEIVDLTGSEVSGPASTAPPKRTVAASLLRRLNLGPLSQAAPLTKSAPAVPPSADLDELEDQTMALLRRAAERKRLKASPS